MKPGCYMSTSALCPYYKCESKQKIVCAGPKPLTCIHYTFGDAAECKKHKSTFCCAEYQRCPIHYVLEISAGRE